MMPQSSQNLYFHLGMNADDDGFCEHFSLMRMTDSKPDDLRILQAKGFVSVFDDKVLVIVDWKENNYLRSDRYTPSKYLEIYKDEMKSLSSGIPNGNQMATQVRLGKDRLDTESDSSLNLLDNPTEELIKEMVSKFKVSDSEVTTKAHQLADYCRSKKKKYANYKAVLSNALRKDFGERKFGKRPVHSVIDGIAKIVGYEEVEI